MKKILLILTLFSLYYSGSAQVSITELPQTYTQNFDSLPATNSTWVNNSTLPGWVFNLGINATNDVPTPTLVTNDGSAAVSFSTSFGSDGSAERALGSIAGPVFIFILDHYYGARFVNNSSNIITQVDLSYRGEQWRDSTNVLQSLQFFYRVGGDTNFVADRANIGWTPAPELNFVSPQNTGVGKVDGNNPANQNSINGSIKGLNVPPGETFWIRWFDIDDGGLDIEDHGLAIDDVTVSFSSPLPGVNLNLTKPKQNKKLKFKGSKGLSIKGLISSEVHPVNKASYAVFGGTNAPTNLTFVTAGKFKAVKGKLAKRGVDFTFQSTKATKAGVGIAAGSSPITLITKIEGTVSNIPASVFFTNVFTDVTVK